MKTGVMVRELIKDKIDAGEVTGKLMPLNQLKNGEIHRKLDDELAVVIQVVLHDGESKRAAVTLRRDMFEEINEEKFIETALENAKKYDKVSLKSMMNMLRELWAEDLELPPVPDGGMFVLTNRWAINGAAAIAYPEVMNGVAYGVGGSYWAIPSSIHEWLIMKDDGEDFRELNEMVHEVNMNEVALDEILSWKVRHYDAKTGKWELGEEFAKRVGRA